MKTITIDRTDFRTGAFEAALSLAALEDPRTDLTPIVKVLEVGGTRYTVTSVGVDAAEAYELIRADIPVGRAIEAKAGSYRGRRVMYRGRHYRLLGPVKLVAAAASEAKSGTESATADPEMTFPVEVDDAGQFDVRAYTARVAADIAAARARVDAATPEQLARKREPLPDHPKSLSVPAGRINTEWDAAGADVAATYSADIIDGLGKQGRIKRPARVGDFLVVCLGHGGQPKGTLDVWRVVPRDEWTGPAWTYTEKMRLDPDHVRSGETARNDPLGFYHGMTARAGGKEWVIVGPKIRLIAEKEAPVPTDDALRRAATTELIAKSRQKTKRAATVPPGRDQAPAAAPETASAASDTPLALKWAHCMACRATVPWDHLLCDACEAIKAGGASPMTVHEAARNAALQAIAAGAEVVPEPALEAEERNDRPPGAACPSCFTLHDSDGSTRNPDLARHLNADPRTCRKCLEPMRRLAAAERMETAAAELRGPNLVPINRSPFDEIPLGWIKAAPWNPRHVIVDESLAELAASIREVGVIEPVIVYHSDPGGPVPYTLLAGERRWRASGKAGCLHIPAIVRSVASEADAILLTLTENLQRRDLNAVEQARGYRALVDRGWTQVEVAAKVGKHQSTVANALALLDLPHDVQRLIASGALSATHGRALGRFRKEPEVCTAIAAHSALAADTERGTVRYLESTPLPFAEELRAEGIVQTPVVALPVSEPRIADVLATVVTVPYDPSPVRADRSGASAAPRVETGTKGGVTPPETPADRERRAEEAAREQAAQRERLEMLALLEREALAAFRSDGEGRQRAVALVVAAVGMRTRLEVCREVVQTMGLADVDPNHLGGDVDVLEQDSWPLLSALADLTPAQLGELAVRLVVSDQIWRATYWHGYGTERLEWLAGREPAQASGLCTCRHCGAHACPEEAQEHWEMDDLCSPCAEKLHAAGLVDDEGREVDARVCGRCGERIGAHLAACPLCAEEFKRQEQTAGDLVTEAVA